MTDNGRAPATLITIPLSHYCEKARWALDHTGFAYQEQGHAPLVHRISTLRNKGGTVPVLVDGEKALTDSRDILVHVNAVSGQHRLYPEDARLQSEVDSLEKLFDCALGPATRRWAYGHLLPQAALLKALWSRSVPAHEAAIVTVILPLARRLVRSAYRINPESAQRSLDKTRTVFAEIDERLSDGRTFLVGERFSAADLTFAALAAPVLLPPQCRAVQAELDEIPEAMREDVLNFRATPAGQFALRMFVEHRG